MIFFIYANSPLQLRKLNLHLSGIGRNETNLLSENYNGARVYLDSREVLSPTASNNLAHSLSQMPHLTHLTIEKLSVHQVFYDIITIFAPFRKVILN